MNTPGIQGTLATLLAQCGSWSEVLRAIDREAEDMKLPLGYAGSQAQDLLVAAAAEFEQVGS